VHRKRGEERSEKRPDARADPEWHSLSVDPRYLAACHAILYYVHMPMYHGLPDRSGSCVHVWEGGREGGGGRRQAQHRERGREETG